MCIRFLIINGNAPFVIHNDIQKQEISQFLKGTFRGVLCVLCISKEEIDIVLYKSIISRLYLFKLIWMLCTNIMCQLYLKAAKGIIVNERNKKPFFISNTEEYLTMFMKNIQK